MNLAQLIDAESAQGARHAQPRQFGEPLGVRRHVLEKAGEQEQLPQHMMAQPETQAEARRVMAERSISQAKERREQLIVQQQAAAQARLAKIDARAARLAAAQAKRLARKKGKGGPKLKAKPARGPGSRSINRQVLEQVLRDGPLMLPALCVAFDAEIKARGLKRVGWYTIKDLLWWMRGQGVIVVHGTKRKYRYALRGGAA